MKGNPKAKTEQPKKPYVRPEVRQVRLRPEEAVLGFCKNTGYSGPGAPNCGVGISPCITPGT